MDLINTWIKIGRGNPWIREANDPLLNRDSFYKCTSVTELSNKLAEGNWSLGQAFYFTNNGAKHFTGLCFINQVNAGDEWLVIRDDIAFESINAQPMIEQHKFIDFINRVVNASNDELITLNY